MELRWSTLSCVLGQQQRGPDGHSQAETSLGAPPPPRTSTSVQASCKRQPFQVTLLQVAYSQWVATSVVFRPERLELSLSLPPSSRPACGVLTIDTSGAAQVRTGARPLVPPASAPPPLPVPETGHPLGWVGFQPRCSRLTAGTTGLSPTATDAAGNVNTRNLRSS